MSLTKRSCFKTVYESVLCRAVSSIIHLSPGGEEQGAVVETEAGRGGVEQDEPMPAHDPTISGTITSINPSQSSIGMLNGINSNIEATQEGQVENVLYLV